MPHELRHSIFISYRRSDSPDTVKLIYERLKQELPRWEIFYDHQSIAPGQEFPELLRKRVNEADIVLVVIGPRWLEALRERQAGTGIDHVREEVRTALETGRTVIPLNVANAKPLGESEFSDYPEIRALAGLNAQPIRPEPDFDGDLERLVNYLEAIGPGEGIGTILAGKYKIVGELGVGGMGVVYCAEQLNPRRMVAVKLIKPGMDSREILARFDAERQALAVMDHPNIARVLDSGTAKSGRPFFVMVYVKGSAITEFCDDKKLSTNERLELFHEVCNAVQHAHQKGIIHRDLKPSNVLVELIDGKPVPKVIDFGLAKALGYKLTDKSLMTTMETRLGTLEYSSPEQAAGRVQEIDTRTDIYSLGALLYALLVGEPPFTRDELLKSGEDEMRRIIRDKDPSRPSVKLSSSHALPAIAENRRCEPRRLARLLRGELDWIVMKALEKDPARRYASASGFEADVKRYLAHEPVTARPASSWYMMRKFMRRHWGPFSAATAIVLLLIAGLIGTGLALKWALRAQREADASAAVARAQSQLALKSLESVVYDIQRGLENVAGAGSVRRKLLQTALERLEQVSEQFASREDIDADTHTALIDLGEVFLRIGSDALQGEAAEGPLAAAEKAFQRALEIAEASVAADPNNPGPQRNLSTAHDKLGDVALQSGKTAEALQHFLEMNAISARLADLNPNDMQAQRDFAVSHEKVGDVLLRQGAVADSLKRYQLAFEIKLKLANGAASDQKAQRDLAVSYHNLGNAHLRLGQINDALRSYRMLNQVSENLLKLDPSNTLVQRDLSVSWFKLGNIHRQLKANEDARRSFLRALEIGQELAAAEPGNTQAQRDVSAFLIELGDLELAAKDLITAQARYQKAMEIRQILAAADPTNLQTQRDVWVATIKLGDVQRQSGALDQALITYKEALQICQALAAMDRDNTESQRDISNARLAVGDVFHEKRMLPEALAQFEEALKITKLLARTFPESAEFQYDLFAALHRVAEIHQKQRQYELAANIYTDGLAVLKALKSKSKLAPAYEEWIAYTELSIHECRLAPIALGDWERLLARPEVELPQLLEMRSTEFVHAGQIADAVQSVAKLRELENTSANQLYNAACVYGLSATSIRTEAGELTADQNTQRKVYVDAALATLREAIAKGWTNHAQMEKDSDLAPLHPLPEFRQLVEQLK